MGVPAFFRWLSRKYPSIVVNCTEEKAKTINGIKVDVDATQPNPNEVEFDNLYLDMNGIIHPCCHPDDRPDPANEEEMMIAIFEYIDRLFNLVRPRRLLYMAIDGVAPRAKMNQQRSRRFRSAKDSTEKLDEIKRIRRKLRDDGCPVPPLKADSEHFDSNCITPGTQFMAKLAVSLQYYIHDRMNNNPAWRGIKVILSDANVPGEGEHKIMDYIRKQRSSPGYDPNTHHCLCGADADLIMLGLATHEPYFTILREEFKPNQPKPCEICNQYGHSMRECTGETRSMQGEFDELAVSNIAVGKEFLFIRITVLREYLEREFSDLKNYRGFKFDLERAIDDWVFMCFFVGNDFLPHLPSLEIRENAIDRLIRLYKDFIPTNNTYLTENGFVDVRSVKVILSELGKVEDEIFRNRKEREKADRERQKQRAKRSRIEDYKAPSYIPEQLAPTPLGLKPSPAVNARHDAYKMRQGGGASLSDNMAAAKSLRAQLLKSKSFDAQPTDSSSSPSSSSDGGNLSDLASRKRKREDSKEEAEDSSDVEDEVRLWEDGWKERYYQSKFCVSCKDIDFVRQVVESYTQGLCWVMAYYYQGCPSWKWYYPFHYAPFASDFCHIREVNNKFDSFSLPFKPLEQLMGVFPAASSKFLPPPWQNLMLDDDSPIIDFYPTDFKIDLNGKKFSWQGVALLPFVDEHRLLNTLRESYHLLSADEASRNSLGCDMLYVYKYNRLYAFAKTLYEDIPSVENTKDNPLSINPKISGNLFGSVWPNKSMKLILDNGNYVQSPFVTLDSIRSSQVICLNFQDPTYPSDFIFESKLHPDVTMPHPTLKPQGMYGPPGSYRPQVGFSPRTHHEPYKTPESARRFVRNALSDPTSASRRDSDGYHHRPGPPSSAVWNQLPPPLPLSFNDPHYQSPYNQPNRSFSGPSHHDRPYPSYRGSTHYNRGPTPNRGPDRGDYRERPNQGGPGYQGGPRYQETPGGSNYYRGGGHPPQYHQGPSPYQHYRGNDRPARYDKSYQ